MLSMHPFLPSLSRPSRTGGDASRFSREGSGKKRVLYTISEDYTDEQAVIKKRYLACGKAQLQRRQSGRKADESDSRRKVVTDFEWIGDRLKPPGPDEFDGSALQIGPGTDLPTFPDEQQSIDLDSDGNTGRGSSTLSSTTIDGEDAEGQHVDKVRPTVATRLEWRHGGEKVYVTGTMFDWNRKTRLHSEEEDGVFATTIHVVPGTHHIRFVVNGDTRTSPDLPTTVDSSNRLVNYIEVKPGMQQSPSSFLRQSLPSRTSTSQAARSERLAQQNTQQAIRQPSRR